MAKGQTMKHIYELTQDMRDALAANPADIIGAWWRKNATEEEQRAAKERGATARGALAFVESVARKAKHGSCACLTDELTFRLAAIFLRTGADGDEFMTPEELRKAEDEAKRKEEARAKHKADAEKKEAKRKAELKPEELFAEARVEAERDKKSKAEDEKRKAEREIKERIMARREREKAIAEQMKAEQLEFDFGI